MVDSKNLNSERNSMLIKFDRIAPDRKLFSWRLRQVLLRWRQRQRRFQQVAFHYFRLVRIFNFVPPLGGKITVYLFLCLNRIWPVHLIFKSKIYSQGRRLHLHPPVDRVTEQTSFFFHKQFSLLTGLLYHPIPEYNPSSRPFPPSTRPSCPIMDHGITQRNQPNGLMDLLGVLFRFSLKGDLKKL